MKGEAMKPNKALRELMARKPYAAKKYAALPGPVQRFLNEWATLEPQERMNTMHQLAGQLQGREGLEAARA